MKVSFSSLVFSLLTFFFTKKESKYILTDFSIFFKFYFFESRQR